MFKPLVVAAIVVSLSAVAHPTAAAPPDTPRRDVSAPIETDPHVPLPRVRPYGYRAMQLFLQGMERSRTMRALVDRLEQSDVIVYVEMQPAIVGRLAGKMTWVAAAGRFRYVRVSLNPQLQTDLLIATLGHELQHALEVALEPRIVSEPTLEAFYARHGMSMLNETSGWDTEAAREMGDVVRRELGVIRSARVAESVQTWDPAEWPIVYRQVRNRLPS